MVVLFDIDGTLIDHNAAEARAAVCLRERAGIEADGVEFLARWKCAVEKHYDRYLSGELTIQEARRARLREAVYAGMTDSVADELSALYLEAYLEECRLFPDVEPMLMRLRGHAKGIISNGERVQQHRKLARAGVAGHFRAWILSAECGVAKPERAIFAKACEAMGVNAAEAVYVGDRRDIDAAAARDAGLHGLWLDRSGAAKSGDRYRIGSLDELPEAIARL